MRDVGEQERAGLVGDLAESFPIERARVCGKSRQDHFWFLAQRDRLDLIHINNFSFFFYKIRNDRIKLAGKIQRMAVRKMSALVQRKSKHFVAEIQ